MDHPFQITLRTDAAQSLPGQLVSQLRHAIEAGRMPPGAPLPSARQLALDLGVSRREVRQVFRQLQREALVCDRAQPSSGLTGAHRGRAFLIAVLGPIVGLSLGYGFERADWQLASLLVDLPLVSAYLLAIGCVTSGRFVVPDDAQRSRRKGAPPSC